MRRYSGMKLTDGAQADERTFSPMEFNRATLVCLLRDDHADSRLRERAGRQVSRTELCPSGAATSLWWATAKIRNVSMSNPKMI